MEGRKEAAYRRSWRLWRSSDAHRNLSRQDLLRESRSWRYSRRKILRPDEFSGLGRSPYRLCELDDQAQLRLLLCPRDWVPGFHTGKSALRAHTQSHRVDVAACLIDSPEEAVFGFEHTA